MRFITEKNEKTIAEKFIAEAKVMAQKATCHRAKCGAVIVGGNEIIGIGFNSPPGNDERERRCEIEKDEFNQKITDKTCCVHAEQRAIMDALRCHPDKIKGSKLYFSRFHPDGRQRFLGGEIQLYCTICAKMMHDTGISEFILSHQDGIVSFSRDEYVGRSFMDNKYTKI
ncbi:MAG: hypothetical protein WC519_01520 [Parcubacteria group bacterium]